MRKFRKDYKSMSEEERRRYNRYATDKRKRDALRLHLVFWRRTNKRVVDKLESVDNKTEYIRTLILRDIGEID